MRYIGNKTKLLSFIQKTIEKESGNIQHKIFCDLFAGSGSVSAHFKPLTKKVISNDLEDYSNVLCKNILSSIEETRANQIISELNSLQPIKGRFTNDFSPAGSRMFFTEKNASKIDAIRLKIEEYSPADKIFAIACLLEAADVVANTTGVYGAFLKKFDKRSLRDIEIVNITPPPGNNGIVYCEDAESVIKKISGDILYLDPPYNNRQYGSNYHILNYLVNYNNYSYKTESKTGIGEYNKSSFCNSKNALNSLENIISNANFNTIFISYNNEGIIPIDKFKDCLSKYGQYSVAISAHKRYKSNSAKDQKPEVVEFLHILKK